MSNPWPNLLNTTIPNYIRQELVNILRSRILLSMLEQKGRVTMNWSGEKLDWKVEYKRAPMAQFADGDTINFSRRDRFKTAQLPWRQYVLTDMMSHLEKLQNRGEQAIIKNYETIIDRMLADFREQFCDELYGDGNAAGRTRCIHGIESFLGSGAAAAPGFVLPSDSFAGLNTAPNSYGGTWTGTWPSGKGDAHYDFYSPILVDFVSNVSGAFSSSTKTWPNTCQEALRKLITKSRKSKAKEGTMDLILLEDDLFEQFKNALDTKVQLPVYRQDQCSEYQLGYDNIVNFDGVMITSEFGLPTNTGYGFNTMQMELCSMEDQLLKSFGPFYDESTQTWRFLMGFYGNARWNPKFFGKLYPYNA